MKIALVYNHDTKNVINLFGIPNREIIGIKTIKRLANALKAGGHQVKTIEGDKDLVDRLEDFMPRVLKGEQPGLVFNVSYGIQGQARYTHVPSILEMVGIPYVGSGPLAHGLALDKEVAKMIFRQHNLSTPDFAVMNSWEGTMPEIDFPLIVKPKNESVSFGVKFVTREEELREAIKFVIENFHQPALVEQFIEGREINVGLIGNNPAEAFAPVELFFGPEGPNIYTYEDKKNQSGRQISFKCPAELTDKQVLAAQNLARRAFEILGCYDYGRVDMRLEEQGNFYLLEVNSLPSLGEHGSYIIGAEYNGLDFTGLINRLVEVAAARYFGTPFPEKINYKGAHQGSLLLSFISQRRDQIEKRLEYWTNISSRTDDRVGLREVLKKLGESMTNIGLRTVESFTDEPFVKTWETKTGFEEGCLLIGHLDVPLGREIPTQNFRRDPEWLYGEGIGLSRAPLVMLEFVLRSLKFIRRLQRHPIGVLYYLDEGRDCHYSTEIIQAAAARAQQVLVLRPGNVENKVIIQRRGQRKYRLLVEAAPRRLGQSGKNIGALRWTCSKLEQLTQLSSRKERMAVAAADLKTTTFPMLLPHRVEVSLLVSYGESARADEAEQKIRQILGKEGVNWKLEMLSDRPAMRLRKKNRQLAESLAQVAQQWEIPLEQESSLWPTIAGLVPDSTAVLCGIGPVAHNLYTPQEAVQRISIIRRTLLLSEFLINRQPTADQNG
ncbi:MAG: hypothetical protein AMJ79_00600 [Phycisphaerae bacterium SM23_30]|nr:MAG: hypothetical protein AMJ79_00600 [Phycisphaerae bacterium SM23_30]